MNKINDRNNIVLVLHFAFAAKNIFLSNNENNYQTFIKAIEKNSAKILQLR